jgi:WD40 repeat protein
MLFLRGARERVEALQFSPDGRALVAPCEGGVQVWGDLAAPGRPTAVLAHKHVRSARFTPEGRKLLIALWSAGLALHDLSTGVAEVAPPTPRGKLSSCELTPDSRAVVAAEVRYDPRSRVRLTLRPLDELASPAWSAEGRRPAYGPPLFLPGGGRFVLFEGEPCRVPFWYVTRDAGTGEVLEEVEGSGEQYHSPVMSADWRLVAARSGVWLAVFRADDFGAGPAAVLRNDSRRHFTGLAFHPSGRFLAATSNDATVKLYDTATWKVARAFDWGVGRLRSVAFSPDGMLAAAGNDKGKIVVWDVDL